MPNRTNSVEPKTSTFSQSPNEKKWRIATFAALGFAGLVALGSAVAIMKIKRDADRKEQSAQIALLQAQTNEQNARQFETIAESSLTSCQQGETRRLLENARQQVTGLLEDMRDNRYLNRRNFSGINASEIAIVETRLKQIFGVDQISEIPKNTATFFRIFNSVALEIPNAHEGLTGIRLPSQVLQADTRHTGRVMGGDCDDKSLLLSIELSLIYGNCTRMEDVDVLAVNVGHAFLRFNLTVLYNYTTTRTGQEYYDQFVRDVANNYHLTLDEAISRLFSRQDTQIEANGRGGFEETRWIVLDPTFSSPGHPMNFPRLRTRDIIAPDPNSLVFTRRE